MLHAGHFQGGTKCVRLTVEIDERDVLISDFEDWHCVLNNYVCSDNEEEDMALQKRIVGKKILNLIEFEIQSGMEIGKDKTDSTL